MIDEVPQKKKTAIGVRGIKLSAGDKLVGAELLSADEEKEIDYNDKKISLNRIRVSKRDTKGVKKS